MALSALQKYVAAEGVALNEAKITARHKFGVSCLPQGRQELLIEAIKGGYTHLLMIDDDMLFPYDMLDCMIGHLAIGVNAVRKNPNKRMYTAFDANKNEIISQNKIGSELVHRCGLGIFLLEIDCMKDIPAPHFEIRYNEATGNYITEDYYFCEKLQAAGIPIRVQHDVSQFVAHVGQMNYMINSYK